MKSLRFLLFILISASLYAQEGAGVDCLKAAKSFINTDLSKAKHSKLPLTASSFDLLHPSQSEYGLPKIAYVSKKIANGDKDYVVEKLGEKVIYVVTDSRGTQWIVDAHHHGIAFYSNLKRIRKLFGDDFDELEIRIAEVANFSGKKQKDFESFMISNHYAYLKDGESLSDLPGHIKELKDDYGRGLSYLLIKSGLLAKDGVSPFIEFYIAEVFAKHFKDGKKNWKRRTILEYRDFIVRNKRLFSHIDGLTIHKQSKSKFKDNIKKYLDAIEWFEKQD